MGPQPILLSAADLQPLVGEPRHMASAIDVIEQATVDFHQNRVREHNLADRTSGDEPHNLVQIHFSADDALVSGFQVFAETPGGPALPNSRFVVLLDPATRQLISIVDYTSLSPLRVGASAGVGCRYLAPQGALIKVAGLKSLVFEGAARVFDSEEACADVVKRRAYKAGEVLVIRYEGPKGGPGMREMLGAAAARRQGVQPDARAPRGVRRGDGRVARSTDRSRRQRRGSDAGRRHRRTREQQPPTRPGSNLGQARCAGHLDQWRPAGGWSDRAMAGCVDYLGLARRPGAVRVPREGRHLLKRGRRRGAWSPDRGRVELQTRLRSDDPAGAIDDLAGRLR